MGNSVKNVLHMESIAIQFDGVMAVDGLTLNVNEHEIIALIGPDGADRITTFNCVTDICQPTFGSTSFNGEVILADTPRGKMRRLYEDDITPTNLTPVYKTPDQVTKLSIARIFQNIRLFGALTVFEDVLITKRMRAEQNVFSTTLHLNRAEEKRMREESMELLEMQGLAHLKNEIAFPLPYGLQRRLEIARALATNPSLLLPDGPTAGMNPQETRGLTDFIHKIRDDYYLTVFMIEYHMDSIMQISNRIYVLDFGRLIVRGTLNRTQNNPRVIKAYLGMSEGAED